MKKLLSILGTITIAGSGMAGLVGNAPAKSNINYQQTNNLETLKRNKRQYSQDISIYVTQTNLGRIQPGRNGEVSELQILNAFVRNNPNLPLELRVTNQRDRIIHVSVNYGDRAIIDVHSGTSYVGSVQVTFNGGQAPTGNYSSGLQWQGRFDISAHNLRTNLNILNQHANQRNIIQAFIFNNQDLPLGLEPVLRVSNIGNGRATIYVPEGNTQYVGSIQVSINEQRSYTFPQEISYF